MSFRSHFSCASPDRAGLALTEKKHGLPCDIAPATPPSRRGTLRRMRAYTAIIERDPDTGLLVGHVPGFPGAHSQATSMDELHLNLQEVISMLLEDGDPILEREFVGTQLVTVE